MDALSRLLIIALGPTVVAGALLWLPRVLRALRDQQRRRNVDPDAPLGPPLERTAADLRRLLAEHHRVRTSAAVAVRAARLRALEGAITDCALDTARAVGLTVPSRAGREALPEGELRSLLAALVASGVVLPSPERFGR